MSRYEMGRDTERLFIEGKLRDGYKLADIMRSEGEDCMRTMRIAQERLNNTDTPEEEKARIRLVIEWLNGRLSRLD